MKLTKADRLVYKISIGFILLLMLWLNVDMCVSYFQDTLIVMRPLWQIIGQLIFQLTLMVMLFISKIKIKYLVLFLIFNILLLI